MTKSRSDTNIRTHCTCSPLDIPNPMMADCTDNFNQGSNCSFSCPSGLRIRQPDDPSFYCDGEGQWRGEKPDCCLTDGCPKNLKVDFYRLVGAQWGRVSRVKKAVLGHFSIVFSQFQLKNHQITLENT